MQVIDQINGSALFAQSAYSAAVATKDSLGRDISTTYLTAHQDLSNYATTGDLDTASSFLSGAIDYVSANAGGSTDNAMTGESQSIVSAFKFYDLTNGGATVSAYTPITAGTYGGAFKLNGCGLILSAMRHTQWGGDLTDVLDISTLGYGIRGNYLGLNSAGVYFNDGFQITWTGIKNTDLGITTGGIVSSISGHLIPSTAGLASQTDLENVSGEIVGLIPSTAGLATEQLVESTSADIVAMIPSTAGLASESDLQTVSGDIVNLIPDTSNFITNTSAETTYQPIGNYASASDITGFATKTELETTSGEIVGLIPSTAVLATETDLQIVSGGVDYISGVALTAIPTGTMNETAFAYNADDLITAYNGSAFAGQGGGSVDTIPVAVISPLVTGFSGESAYLGIESTALNLSSYVPVSAIGVNSLGYVSGISGMNISAYYSRNSLTANYASTANRSYEDRNGNEITSYYQPKLTITGDAGTITSINGSAVGASIPEGWELVAGAGISIVDDAENNQTTISVRGLEPSATYNETVLWSTYSPDTKTTGTLNDSIWNYERFKMYISTFQGGDYVTELVATGGRPGTATRSFITYGPRGHNNCSFDMCKWIFSDTGFSAVSSKSLSFLSTWTATAITIENNQTAALGYCHKIVGINRKQ